MIDIEIKDGKVHFTLPLNDPPEKSKSGKTLIVSSSGGWKSVKCNGVFFKVYVKAYTYENQWEVFKAGTKPAKLVSKARQKEIEEHNKKVSEKIAKGK